MASNSDKEIEDNSDDRVYIRPSKKKIMTSQIVTNDELTNLIQERWTNRQTGKRTEFANQLARKLIKKLHDKDEKIRKVKGKKKGVGIKNKKLIKEEIVYESDSIDDSDLEVIPPPVIKKKSLKKKHEVNMSGKEITKILEEKKSTIDKQVANKFTSTLKSRLANKLKKKFISK